METKHTKGEWKYDSESGLVYVQISEERSKCIANITGDTEIKDCLFIADFNQTEANARLIAAAPEMLEALDYVIKWHREHDSGEGELFGLDFVTTCIAAKRKATE